MASESARLLAPGNTTPARAGSDNTAQGHYITQPRSSINYAVFVIEHRIALLTGILVGLAAGCGVATLQTPIYRAETSLAVQDVNENLLNLRAVDPTPPPALMGFDRYMQTQAEMIEGDEILDPVIARLGLRSRREFMPGREPIDVVRSWLGLATTEIHEVPPIELNSMVRLHMRVDPSNLSRIIRISFDSSDPKFAASFLNVLTGEFVSQSSQTRLIDSNDMRSWLNSQLEQLKGRLEGAERGLQDYARAAGITEGTGAETPAEARLKELQNELLRAEDDRIAREALWETVRDGIDAKGGAVPQALDSGAVREDRAKLTELRRQLAETSSLMTPQSYKVTRIQAQISELESALTQELSLIRSRAQSDYNASVVRETLLRNTHHAQATVVSEQASKLIRYHVLEREAASDKQMYDSLLQRVKEAGVAAVMGPAPIRVIGSAKVPFRPFKPNWPLNEALGAFGGLWTGIAAAVFLRQFNRRLRSPGDGELLLNLPELGTVPKIAPPRRLKAAQRTLLDADAGNAGIIATHQGSPAVCEAFRNIVASILANREPGRSPQVLFFTSAVAGEGKSTVISNVAVALAETGRRVVLLDCDLRRPRLQDIFDVPNTWGIGDLVRESQGFADLPIESLVKATKIPGVRIIPSGPGVDNIASVLYSPRLLTLIFRLRKHFDFVLVDAPPLLHFADARILAGYCDAAVVVYRANVTTQAAAACTVQRLSADGIPIIGAVLNDCPQALIDNLYLSPLYESVSGKRV